MLFALGFFFDGVLTPADDVGDADTRACTFAGRIGASLIFTIVLTFDFFFEGVFTPAEDVRDAAVRAFAFADAIGVSLELPAAFAFDFFFEGVLPPADEVRGFTFADPTEAPSSRITSLCFLFDLFLDKIF